jgi:hypothetical protein
LEKQSKYLFNTLVGLLFIPLILGLLNINFVWKSLDGVFALRKKPPLSFYGWSKGHLQEDFEKYITDNISCRDFFVRFFNQCRFSLFRLTNTDGVIVGTNDILFQTNYIEALNGIDSVNLNKVQSDVVKFKELYFKLKEINKSLILVIAPGKASFFKEYIPEKFLINNDAVSNYNKYERELKSCGVPYFDAKQFLLQKKSKEKYPLFPRSGTHWSGYAITLVMDSLSKFIENETGYNLLNFKSEPGVVTTTEMRFTDDDIGKAMNLLVPIKNWPMYYPKIVFEKDANRKRLNLLSIGDSFNQSFFGFYPYFSELFGNDSQYWYYNRTVSWPDSIADKYIDVHTLNLRDEIMKRDVIMVVTTEQNLNNFGFDFFKEANAALIDVSN